MSNWHGFIPNCVDVKIYSSYVNENSSNGLKQNSKEVLGYEQTDYATATTIEHPPGQAPYPGGRVVWHNGEAATKARPAIPATMQRTQYRMNELPARTVVSYGCDDTVCTAALFNHFEMVMEIEGTLSVYREVEVKPAYLTALGYITGANVSLERLKELERADDKVFEAARIKLSETLVASGLLDKMWKPYPELTAAVVKDAFEELYGTRPETQVRTLSKLAAQIRREFMSDDGDVTIDAFCDAVENSNLPYINGLVKAKYRNNPVIDIGSPKRMREFLYGTLGLPVRVLNKVTQIERQHNRPLADAVTKFTRAAMDGVEPNLTQEEYELILGKAKTNEIAVKFALELDATGTARDVLQAMSTMKKIVTRRSFYYSKYPALKHWKDGKIHASLNQCATVTRRYSSSGPNLQQLPKKGEGVKIREMIIPHQRRAVIVSLDFSGQELRMTADQSGDEAMLACYIGDKLKDIHSITASGAMEKKWGKDKLVDMAHLVGVEVPQNAEQLYDLFARLRKHKDEAVAKMADDLRKVAKNVNFAATYDSQALTLSQTIIIPVKEAQDFLDAKYRMFPDVETWKDRVRADVESKGYATTMMGARRHFAALLADRFTANKVGRQGPNFRIQSSSSEQTKLAMTRVWDSGVCFDYDCRFIAPIHDELVFSIGRDDAVEAIRIINACMTGQYADMRVPAVASISLGKNFGHQIECGDYFDAAAITDALVEVFKEDKAWVQGLQSAFGLAA